MTFQRGDAPMRPQHGLLRYVLCYFSVSDDAAHIGE